MRNTIYYKWFLESLSEEQRNNYIQELSINQQKDFYISYLESNFSLKNVHENIKMKVEDKTIERIILSEKTGYFPKGNVYYRFNANNWASETPLGIVMLEEDFDILEKVYQKL